MTQVVTGDAVVLDVQVAQLPVRAVSALVDIAVMMLITLLGYGLVALTVQQLDDALVMTLLIVFVVLVPVVYPTAFETATRGRSLGKMAMGLRVVSDDGGPERFTQALFRALASVIEIWALFGSPAVICSMFSARGKRLGDVFAGTVVISERGPRLPPPPTMPPGLDGWASTLQLSGLTPQSVEMARQFLARAPHLDAAIRDQMGYRIAGEIAARIAPPPPPGLPAPLLLAAVLAERHRRELARLQPPGPPPPGYGPPPPGYGAAPPVPPGPPPPGGLVPPG
ncbi:RDD family protein [Mycolicibacillus parakoreensis]|uniref:RDD family protein n=1 Tax=Mycolicibacillus parakoreensis TaxID=1069221 RepID=A0ABY3TYZ2_9MYCO|nr:RDD family protein [Mycolicibacillus parakoreensis]MCV7314194.1 RDD family protein [Mycolicibacillus parakoreensis]ULN52910.1 RDD family protein [Mycolicibacillus parakoreensis]